MLRSSSEPAALCSLLERLWSALDALAAHHGAERIDAFDGCYMAAANYSAQQPTDHAVRLARFATAAIAAAAAIAVEPLGPVQLLGGMHCGAVCGRVVGAHGGLGPAEAALLARIAGQKPRLADPDAPGPALGLGAVVGGYGESEPGDPSLLTVMNLIAQSRSQFIFQSEQ